MSPSLPDASRTRTLRRIAAAAAVLMAAVVVFAGPLMAHDPGASAPRTPEEIRARGNRLAGASSLYLRQHAHNPVVNAF